MRCLFSFRIRDDRIMVRARWRGPVQNDNRGRDVTRYYLGVDGGGTNCRIRFADENLVTLGEAAIREASNLQIEAGAAGYQSIIKAIDPVLQQASLSRDVLQGDLRMLLHGRRTVGIGARCVRCA